MNEDGTELQVKLKLLGSTASRVTVSAFVPMDGMRWADELVVVGRESTSHANTPQTEIIGDLATGESIEVKLSFNGGFEGRSVGIVVSGIIRLRAYSGTYREESPGGAVMKRISQSR